MRIFLIIKLDGKDLKKERIFHIFLFCLPPKVVNKSAHSPEFY